MSETILGQRVGRRQRRNEQLRGEMKEIFELIKDIDEKDRVDEKHEKERIWDEENDEQICKEKEAIERTTKDEDEDGKIEQGQDREESESKEYGIEKEDRKESNIEAQLKYKKPKRKLYSQTRVKNKYETEDMELNSSPIRRDP